jgi:hypothetical protein
MLVEVHGDEAHVREFASAVGETVEYCDAERRGRWWPECFSSGQWARVMDKLSEVSYRFPLIIHDCGDADDGPSVFHEPGVRWDAFYRVAMEEGSYRILDLGWVEEEMGESERFTFYRIKDGVRHDVPLVEVSDILDHYESGLIYEAGDDLSEVPKLAALHREEIWPPTSEHRLIQPVKMPPVDFSVEGF